MNISTPEALAGDLSRLNPEVVAATCGQLLDITSKARRVGMGDLVMRAIFEPQLLEQLVKAQVMGEVIEELEGRQILPMHFRGACSNISDSGASNDDDLMYCRAAGQMWKSSPKAYQKTYPTSRLWSDDGDWHIVRYAAILTKSQMVMKGNPTLMGVGEAAEFVYSVEEAAEDIRSMLDGVAQQCLHFPDRISRMNAFSILDVLIWLHNENKQLPPFDPNPLQVMLCTIEAGDGVRKASPAHRRVVSFIRRRELEGISQKRPSRTTLPRI